MASMLEPFIPRPHVLERARIAVVAEPAQAWEAMRHIDTFRSKVVRALFVLRRAPDLLTGHLDEAKRALTSHASIDDFAAPDSDFELLQDMPARGFVLGAVGRFWKPHLEFHHVAPHQFASFDQPGFAKVAWGLSVNKRRAGGSWITFEVRAVTTDHQSQLAFDRYWAAIAPFGHAIRDALLGLLKDQLAPIDPANISMPGDLILPAHFSTTRGVVIEAPPAQVWPWLAQMGCLRAGWYSFDRLDNGGEPSAEIIHREWQNLEPGALIATTPDDRAHLGVLVCDRNRALVLGSPSLRKSGPPTSELEPLKVTWAWALDPIGEDACWLGARTRIDVETLDFVRHHSWEALMHDARQRAQLQNLKRRAEQRPPLSLMEHRQGRGAPLSLF